MNIAHDQLDAKLFQKQRLIGCVAAILCLLFCTCAFAQTDVERAQKYAEEFGAKGFTKCPARHSVIAGPFPVDILSCAMNSRNHVNSCWKVIEFSKSNADLSFRALKAREPSTAESMNGLRWVGTIQSDYEVWRTRLIINGSATKWSEWVDRDQPERTAKLQRIGDKWLISDLRDMDDASLHTSDLMEETPAAGFTARPLVSIDEFWKTLKPLDCDGYVDEPPEAPDPATEFSGSPDEFAKVFPGLMQKAALKYGIDPRTYQKEIAYLINAVNTCAKITPKIAATLAQGTSLEYLPKLGPQYAICRTPSISASAGAGNIPMPKSVVYFELWPVGDWYRDGKGFKVVVSLVVGMENTLTAKQVAQAHKRVISATIHPADGQ